MCLILREEGGCFCAGRQTAGSPRATAKRAHHYRLDEALVTFLIWKVHSHNVAVLAQHFQLFVTSSGNGRARRARRVEKPRNLPKVHLLAGGTAERKVAIAFRTDREYNSCYSMGNQRWRAGVGSSYGRWSGHVVGQEDGNHRQN
jgi:hypothetical protein